MYVDSRLEGKHSTGAAGRSKWMSAANVDDSCREELGELVGDLSIYIRGLVRGMVGAGMMLTVTIGLRAS